MNRKNSKISDGYSAVRYFVPSPLLDSQAAKPTEAWARRRAVAQLTYQTLLDNQQRQVIDEGLNEQTASNRATALRGFLKANGIHIDDVVGDEMRAGHSAALERFLLGLQELGQSARTVSNTKSAFRHWKDAVIAHDTIQAAHEGKATPFQSTLATLLENRAAATVGKRVGIPRDMMYGWIKGKIPRGNNVNHLLRLEAFFGLERHSLVQRSGMRLIGQRQAHVGKAPAPIAYRTILGT